VIELVRKGLKETGWDEVSLISLSSSDHSQLEDLVEMLPRELEDQGLAISLPSLRPDAFSERLARGLSQFRRSGLTFAPECGSQRLGAVINKEVSDEALLSAISHAFDAGWRQVKLYFMVGLPTETSDDLQALVDLVQRAAKEGRKKKGRIKVAISPFVAKAHTPFQWEAQASIAEVKEKEQFIVRALRSRNVDVKWRNPEISFLEGVLARGDRALGRVVERAWRKGCRFDEWSEHFRFDLWESAFSDEGIDAEEYLRSRPVEGSLPWDHIDVGVSRAYLAEAKACADAGEVTPDCREGECTGCGLPCEAEGHPFRRLEVPARASPESDEQMAEINYGRRKRRIQHTTQPSAKRYRVKYRKTRIARFLSHLDLMRATLRSVRRAGLPLAYSQGIRPRPKLSFGPPLSVGTSGLAEFFDLQLSRGYPGNLAAALARHMPPGIDVIDAKPIYSKARSLCELITSATYRIEGLAPSILERAESNLAEIMARDEVVVRRTTGGKDCEVDIRPYIASLRVTDGPVLEMTLKLTNKGTARPMEVLREGLAQIAVDPGYLQIERTDLLVDWDGVARSPMDFV
jgi:radical SAM-linked protein